METLNIHNKEECSKLLLSLLFILSITCGQVECRLYPYGEKVGDSQMLPFDETSTSEITLRVPIIYYGVEYETIYINSNGILSFLTEIPNFFNIQFPLEYPIIAGLYSDVDISTAGDIWYRETSAPDILSLVKQDIRDNFYLSRPGFEPREVFVVTWDHVAGSGLRQGLTNTFQITIASDGQDSFVIFIYEEGGVQWIQSAGKSPSQPDAIAQAGLLSGDGRMHLLRASGTDQVRNLPIWSNIGSPGKWMFRVGQLGDRGNESVVLPDTYTQVEENNFDSTCSQDGSVCHSAASCIDYVGGFCCQCDPGRYGNGINCINDDVPIRVTGKLTGRLNDYDIGEADLHSYTLPLEGRTYTAVSHIPESLGYDVQTASVIAEGIVWLFARSKEGVPNGFMLTGGRLTKTVEVNFPETGDHFTVTQRFHGLDVFNNIDMTTEIIGSTPEIPTDTKLQPNAFVEEFTRVKPGMLLSQSTRSYSSKAGDLTTTYDVSTTIEFEECELGINSSMSTIKLKITDNGFIQYDRPEEIIRYAFTAKVGPLTDVDPCIEGRVACGRNSQCVVNDDTFRCICDRGYEHVFDPAVEKQVCIDKNECKTGRHQCSPDASCLNTDGGYLCTCNEGFSGNGYHCASIDVCDHTMCGVNAVCQINGDVPVCVCKTGFVGDGYICTSVYEHQIPDLPYDYDNSIAQEPDYINKNNDNDNNNKAAGQDVAVVDPYPDAQDTSCAVQDGLCSPDAVCIYDDVIHDFACVCVEGFSGDGRVCQATDRIDSCNVVQNCSPYASCVEIQGKFECLCFEGFYGDGLTCHDAAGIFDQGTGHDKGSNSLDYNYNQFPYPGYDQLPYDPSNSLPETQLPVCVGGDCWCEEGYALIHDICILNQQWIPDFPQIGLDDGVVWPTCGLGGCTCPEGYEYVENLLQCRIVGNTGVGYDNQGKDENLEARPLPECLFDECICPVGYEYVPSSDACHPNPQPGWDHSIHGPARKDNSCEIENRCDVNAECLFDDTELRSVCVCNEGYSGDGIQCTPQDECSSPQDCHTNAQCVFNTGLHRYECMCNEGYQGDGITCNIVKDASCHTLNNCPDNSECKFNPYVNDYECQCVDGYVGDGLDCLPEQIGCDVLNNCGRNADCEYNYNERGYRCRCKNNYEGDGFFCKPTLPCNQDLSICHPQATCVRDQGSFSGFTCKCISGYTGDGFSCQEAPEFESDILIINQGMAVLRMPARDDGGSGFPIHVDTFMTAVGGDVDCLQGRYYWTDMGTSTIRSSGYDGAEKSPTVSGGMVGSPEDVAVDWVSGNLYWTDSANDVISVSSIDGLKRKIVIADGLVNPRGIAVHPGTGLLFWSDWNRLGPKIEVSGLDGTNRRVLVEGDNIKLPNSLLIDYYNQNLCWVDAGTHRIECIGIEGGNRRVILEDAKYPFGFTLFEDSFFYTDWNDTKIHQVDKYSGTEVSSRVPPPGGSGKLYDIVSVPSKCPAVSNVCSLEKGHCPPTHMCLPNGRGGRTCACPTNVEGDCQDIVY